MKYIATLNINAAEETTKKENVMNPTITKEESTMKYSTTNTKEESTMKYSTTNTKEESTMKYSTINKEESTMKYSTTIATKSQPLTRTYLITHYDMITGTTSKELHHTNDGFRFVEKWGHKPEKEFIFVNCRIDWFDPYYDAKRAELSNAIDNGITIDGITYKPLCCTSSGAKMAQQIWCNEKHLNWISKMCRFNFKMLNAAMEPNKFFTRMGLCFSSSTPIEEVYPNFHLDYNKVVVLPDIYRGKLNASDGVLLVIDGSNNLPSEAATWRPMLKGAAIPVNKREFLDLVGNQELIDLWGNEANLKDAQIVAFESTFKWVKVCKSREQFIAAFKQCGLSVAVRMNKHNIKHLTYQPVQTLRFNEENLNKIKDIGASYIKSLSELKNFIRLLPPEIREAAMIYPQITKDGYVAKAAKTAYRKQKMTIRGGALPNAGKFFCITADLVDLFGGNGLKAGQCSIKSLPEGKLILVRYPHTSEASFVVLDNVHIDNGITDSNVLVLNNYDDSLRRLGGADYDGDKVFVVTDKEIEKIILDTLEEMGPCSMPEAIEGKAVKVIFDQDNAQTIKKAYFMSITEMSQIGSVSNRLSAAYATLYEAYAKLNAAYIDGNDEEIAKAKATLSEAQIMITYFQQKVEITVDKEKHGDTELPEPKCVKDMNKKLGEFVKYAKIAKRIGTDQKMVVNPENYEFRGACPLEQYGAYVNEVTAKAEDFVSTVDGAFYANNLRFEGELPALNNKVFHKGESVKDENGNTVFVNHGTFDKLVFANSTQLFEMGKERGINGTGAQIRKALMERLMEVYAEHYGCKTEDVYNLIVFYVFSMGDTKLGNCYKRVFWETLHKYAERALTERFGTKAIECELNDIDDLDDDEEDDIEF